jgi:hypothetical protein
VQLAKYRESFLNQDGALFAAMGGAETGGSICSMNISIADRRDLKERRRCLVIASS